LKEWVNGHFGWLLSRYRAYRRWYGGHWEQWYTEIPVGSLIWYDMDRCSRLPPLHVFDPRRGLDDYVAHTKQEAMK